MTLTISRQAFAEERVTKSTPNSEMWRLILPDLRWQTWASFLRKRKIKSTLDSAIRRQILPDSRWQTRARLFAEENSNMSTLYSAMFEIKTKMKWSDRKKKRKWVRFHWKTQKGELFNKKNVESLASASTTWRWILSVKRPALPPTWSTSTEKWKPILKQEKSTGV